MMMSLVGGLMMGVALLHLVLGFGQFMLDVAQLYISLVILLDGYLELGFDRSYFFLYFLGPAAIFLEIRCSEYDRGLDDEGH